MITFEIKDKMKTVEVRDKVLTYLENKLKCYNFTPIDDDMIHVFNTSEDNTQVYNIKVVKYTFSDEAAIKVYNGYLQRFPLLFINVKITKENELELIEKKQYTF